MSLSGSICASVSLILNMDNDFRLRSDFNVYIRRQRFSLIKPCARKRPHGTHHDYDWCNQLPLNIMTWHFSARSRGVHGNRPVWNKTQNRGDFKYRVSKDTRKFRHTTVHRCVSLRVSESFMAQTESEMMLRSTILWFKFDKSVWERRSFTSKS